MSSDNWLRAAKAEEERLLAEIAKTTLYKQLVAVRAVIAVYDGTAEAPEASDHHQAAVVASRANGSLSQRGFKTANAFSDLSDAVTDVNVGSKPQ